MTARRSGGYILVMCSYRNALPALWVDGQNYVEVRGSSTFEQSSTLFTIPRPNCLDVLTCLLCSLGSHAPLLPLGSLTVDAGTLSPGCGPLATENMTISRILDSSSCEFHKLTSETSSFLSLPVLLKINYQALSGRSSTIATFLAREGSPGSCTSLRHHCSERRPPTL